MIFEWNDSLAVGHPLIDTEHRYLIGLINRLAEGIDEGSNGDLLGTILCELSEYCSHHFEHEEWEMLRLHYSEYTRHKAQHEVFVQRLSDLVYSFELQREGLSHQTLSVLTDWLINHIGIEDRKLARLLQEAGC